VPAGVARGPQIKAVIDACANAAWTCRRPAVARNLVIERLAVLDVNKVPHSTTSRPA
jgi:hypothetical protein